MKIIGSKLPLQVELIKSDKNTSIFALRRNIIERNELDSFTENNLKLYEYEEVRIEIKNRHNLIEYIQSNFDNWFVAGLNIEKEKEEIKTKEEQIKQLIEGKKQLDVNNTLNEEVLLSFEAITELYKVINILSNENITFRNEIDLLKAKVDELVNIAGGTTNE